MSELNSVVKNIGSEKFLTDQNLFNGVLELFREPFGMDEGLLRTLGECVATDLFIVEDPTSGCVTAAAAATHTIGEALEIVFLATNPKNQREGRAKNLLEAIEAAALASGTNIVRASVEEERVGMRDLLRSFGYMPSKRLGDEYQKQL